jgi:uncharacterized protein
MTEGDTDQGDTAEILNFLRRAASPAGDGSGTELVSTHISHVVIGPKVVFKLKRPVKLGYVDFSTAERRLATCRREVELNRRTDPKARIYRDALALTRGRDGALAFDGPGSPVDAVVRMHPFDQKNLLDRLAGQGPLPMSTMEALAGEIAELHDKSPASDDVAGARRMARVLDINRAAFEASGLCDAAGAERLDARFRAALAGHSATLDRRAAEGRVRRCHGDLHLRNICLIDDRPVIFDCLEFDEDLATTDILYDLAFLLMDLWQRGRRREANCVFNRYCDATGEADLGLLPFFVAVRAAVRAHVSAAAQPRNAAGAPADLAEAKAYLALAEAALAPHETALVAVGGLSGSGKSTVAAVVAPEVGALPGARTLNSDRLRKRAFGAAVEARLGPGAYRPEVSERIYALLRHTAQDLLGQGVSVIADAVHARPGEREAIAAVARAAGRRFVGLWLDLPAGGLKDRVGARRGGPSDAVVATVDIQLGYDLGDIDWNRLDASRQLEATGAEALAKIRPGAP